MTPSPVVELNRAVAGVMLEGIESCMLLLNRLAETGELDDYYLVHAARADLRRHSGKVDEAHSAYTRALGRCQNNTERSFHRRPGQAHRHIPI